MPRQVIPIGPPGTISSSLAFWALRARELVVSPLLVEGGHRAVLGTLILQDDTIRLEFSAGSEGTGQAGPDLTQAWRDYPEALSLEAGNEVWTFPGPGGSDDAEPYLWSHLGVAAAIAEYDALGVVGRADTALVLDDGIAAPEPGSERPSPMVVVQRTLAGLAGLPAVHPHLYRGPPRAAALVVTALGGEGITGIGFAPQRNIESLRLESRAASWMDAEAALDRAVAALRHHPRAVAIEATTSDYDPATEVYRVFATADIRR